jgi:nicotinamidase/pyrazinamidase
VKTAFFDVDTQLDFLFPGGALYSPGVDQIAESLAALTNFAVERRIPIISTLDSHIENDAEFKVWRAHCVIGTHGHQKYSGTLAPPSAKQIIVPKNVIDVFASKHVDEAINHCQAGRYVVYGLVTEYCVQAAAKGLLKRNLPVDLVTDAIWSLNAVEGSQILGHLASAGVRLVTTAQVLAAS